MAGSSAAGAAVVVDSCVLAEAGMWVGGSVSFVYYLAGGRFLWTHRKRRREALGLGRGGVCRLARAGPPQSAASKGRRGRPRPEGG